MAYKDYIYKIFRVNALTQSIFALVEEFDFKAYIGPLNEQRNSHTHLVRALAAIEGFRENCTDEYIVANLKGAINHEYRAFYDVADWFTVKMREEIIAMLTSYSEQAIATAIPRYYPEYYPRLNSISSEIAGLRLKKDIGNGDLAEHMEPYEILIYELGDIYKDIISRKGALVDIASRQDRSGKQQAWRMSRGPAVGAVIGAIIGFILGKLGLLWDYAYVAWKHIIR